MAPTPGRKSGGRGFYEYVEGTAKPMPVAPVPDVKVPKAWIAAHGLHDEVAATAAKLGCGLDRGDRPGPDSLVLVAPLGQDTVRRAILVSSPRPKCRIGSLLER